MTDRIERQIERFAPGFRDVVAARHVMNPAAFEAHNPNLVGGDFTGGASTARRRRRPAAACMACAVTTPRRPRCGP
jgi:phytoene dehydrogenase-like protein